MAQANTLLDLNAMMDASMDAIVEAPDFVNPPAGNYQLSVKSAKVEEYKSKDGVSGQRIRLTYAVDLTIETASGEPPVADGSLFSETFMATEQGLGFFKARVKAIMNASDLAGVTLGDMLSSILGVFFYATLTIRKTPNPKSPGEFYENINLRITNLRITHED